MSEATKPGYGDYQEVFLECGALQWTWWLDEEVYDDVDDLMFCGVLWGGSGDDDDLWVDFIGHEHAPAFEFEMGFEGIEAGLRYIAATVDDPARQRALGLSTDAVFESAKWLAGEWADADWDADTADQVLQVAVQLANGVKTPVVLYA